MITIVYKSQASVGSTHRGTIEPLLQKQYAELSNEINEKGAYIEVDNPVIAATYRLVTNDKMLEQKFEVIRKANLVD